MGIALSDFLARVEEIAGEKPTYRKGGSGKDGTCDCIGLVIGAVRRAGGTWSGLHGSNYAARSETVLPARIRSASDLKTGELVYKQYAPGEKGYDLPDRYRKGGSAYTGDLRDYFHVGVVMSASPLRILHVTGPGVQTDACLGSWSYHGWCARVDREDGPAARAAAGNGDAVSVPRAELEKAYGILGDLLGYGG